MPADTHRAHQTMEQIMLISGKEILNHLTHAFYEQGLPAIKAYFAKRAKQPAVEDPAAAYKRNVDKAFEEALRKEQAAKTDNKVA
jgi:hypothetical protein